MVSDSQSREILRRLIKDQVVGEQFSWCYNVMPFDYPQQAGSLGEASKKWTALHEEWVLSKLRG